MTDLIVISLEVWDDVWRRNQFVCAALADRHPERTILFVTPARDMSNGVRRGQWRSLRRTPSWSPAGSPNVVVFTPTKWLPNSLGLGRTFNEAVLRRQVLAEVRRLGLVRPAVWVNDHAAAHLAGRLGESGLVYDVTDDWASFDQSAALRARTVSQDAALCRQADAVIVCSDRLYELKAGLARSLYLIPNGVDADHYRAADDPSAAVAAAAGWPRPVLGYTGTVHPDRVDVDLIGAVARRWPGSVVLVGPDHLLPGQAAALDRDNVRRVGPVPYAQVPSYMAGFDVCIVPHRVTPFTESLNPIKLWEYLAAGKPVVSTPVAGFRDFPDLVRLAATAEAFVDAARAAVDERGTADALAVSERRRAVARDHSWARRVDAIEDVLATVAAANGAGGCR